MNEQPLHLVFGGKVNDTQGVEFSDLDKLDTVGIYTYYKAAFDAWKSKSQTHVDNASMKYVSVHMHRLLEPETSKEYKTEISLNV